MSDTLERLRDTFAAAALTGLLARPVEIKDPASSAYVIADAMLRERGNQSEKPNSSPTLTAEEREAIDGIVAFLFGLSDTCVQVGTRQTLRERAATLRSLLERTT
jgi:hypothetical protein